MEFIQDTLFGKTSAEPSPQTKERTSEQYSKASAKSQTKPYLYLNLTNGHLLGASWEMVTPSHGECSMLNTGESPSVAAESTLSQILEVNVPEKYYLSAKACEGILRRAERRGKQLPDILKTALEQQIIRLESDAENPGGGKGALIQENKAGTLATNNDQTLFQSCYSIDPSAARDIGKYILKDVSNPLFNGSCPGHHSAVCYCVDQGGGKSGANVSEDISPTLTTTGEPAVCYGVDGYNSTTDKVASTLGVNCGMSTGRNGVCYSINGEKAGTLDASYYKGCGERQGVERDVVCYALDRASYNQGKNAQYDFSVLENQSPTMIAKGPNAVCCSNYIVRRLTPIECARLQGFPDWWCSGLESDPTEKDIDWWYEVFETHRKAMGKSTKPKSRKQIEKWLKNPHSDSAEYKMWGNGVALPCVYYVLKGIVCQDR